MLLLLSQMGSYPPSVKMIKNVAMNVGQDIIVITRDRVELCLLKNAAGLEQRRAWLVPFGILLSLLLALVTSDPHDWLTVPKEFWRAVFVLLAVASLAWLVVAAIKATKAKTVDDLLQQLQAESREQTSVGMGRPAEGGSRAT